MFRLLVIAFVIVPILEIYLIVQVDEAIGGWETLGLLMLISVVGAWLVRREGFSILARLQTTLRRGELPANELIDGLLVVFAGALLLTPGFFTDALGFVLLLPPTRAMVRTLLKTRFAGRLVVGGGAYGVPFGGRGFTDDDDDDDEPPGAIELGPIRD